MPRPKSNKVTLRDIANIMGMTPATISKALRDGNDISEETRQKVKKVAEEMGYRPNILARSLVQRRSFMLGVVVPNLRISFFSEVTRGMYERARERDYEAIIVVNDEISENEERNLEFLSALGVDGILIDAVPGENNNPVFERLIKRRIPIVAYDRYIDGMEFDSVTIDDEKACFDVVEYLVQQNRKNILFLGPTEKLFVARGRYRGYLKGLDFHNLPFEKRLVVPCDLDPADAESKMAHTMASGLHFDAVICVGGLVAYGGGQAILKSGRSIPEDVMLAEFGDNDVVARLGVPFLTVYQFPYEMGQKAVDLLLELVESTEPRSTCKHKIINTKLVYHEIGVRRYEHT
ncbi:LacI family transcriptional regulator [candidate division KSB1 bacterium]|nr:LacI family DNA-binding transcriptional regulator [candidate division KSB1 bacterium]RQW06012.1 MAG: LacI family transcriptional regulator [candidate division KSB1 bacterium]